MNRKETKPSTFEVIFADPWIYVFAGAFVAGWAIYLMKAAFGIVLFGGGDHPSDSIPTEGLLYLALFFSLGLPAAIYRFKLTKRLLMIGEEVPFDIISRGGSKHGMQDVVVSYQVGGKSFKKKVMVGADEAENGFRLLVDPAKPKRVTTKPLDQAQ